MNTARIGADFAAIFMMERTVPTPHGEIKLYVNEKTIKVTAKGYLTFVRKSKPKASKGAIEKQDGNKYRRLIDGKEEVLVSYK